MPKEKPDCIEPEVAEVFKQMLASIHSYAGAIREKAGLLDAMLTPTDEGVNQSDRKPKVGDVVHLLKDGEHRLARVATVGGEHTRTAGMILVVDLGAWHYEDQSAKLKNTWHWPEAESIDPDRE